MDDELIWHNSNSPDRGPPKSRVISRPGSDGIDTKSANCMIWVNRRNEAHPSFWCAYRFYWVGLFHTMYPNNRSIITVIFLISNIWKEILLCVLYMSRTQNNIGTSIKVDSQISTGKCVCVCMYVCASKYICCISKRKLFALTDVKISNKFRIIKPTIFQIQFCEFSKSMAVSNSSRMCYCYCCCFHFSYSLY